MAITTYQEAREKFPDSIILLRTENGYKVTGKDASIVYYDIMHNPYVGEVEDFVFEDLEHYLPKIVRSGHRVAIIDETIVLRHKQD
jgi:DNA mismatch repair ATPase MutS